MSIYWICAIPIVQAITLLVFGDDMLNVRKVFYLGYLSAVISFLAGAWIFYFMYVDRPGLFWVNFSIPLVYMSCFEALRLIYKKLRHQDPCITNWTSISGNHPRGGFFSEYPAEKLVSLGDFIFSVAHVLVPLGIIFVLILVSLINRW